METFLADYHNLIVLFHALSAGVGVGAVTVADILFFRFLSDYRISKWESQVLNILSQIIWAMLALLIITGIGLYIPEAAVLNDSSKFLAKVVIVLVILVNGIVLNVFVSPSLKSIRFAKAPERQKKELHTLRRIAFAMGAISMASWYSAFVLGSLRSVNLSFFSILLIYLVVILFAIIVSQIQERRIGHHARYH